MKPCTAPVFAARAHDQQIVSSNLINTIATYGQTLLRERLETHTLLYPPTASSRVLVLCAPWEDSDAILWLNQSTTKQPFVNDPYRYDVLTFCDLMCLSGLSNTYDIIIATFFLHTVRPLPSLLQNLKNCLKPGGTLILPLIGNDTLSALRAACAQADMTIFEGVYQRFLPLVHWQDAAQLLQHSGYHQCMVQNEDMTLTAPVQHVLKALGQHHQNIMMAEAQASGIFLTLPAAPCNKEWLKLLQNNMNQHEGKEAEGPPSFTIELMLLSGYA